MLHHRQSGHTREGYGTVSDQDGNARLLDQPAGKLRLVVRAEGYERLRREDLVASEEGSEVRVELEPDDRQTGSGPRIQGPDGQPLMGAAVLALTPSGATDYRCSQRTTAAGEIRLRPECLSSQERRFVLLHESAAFQVLDLEALRQGGEIRVPAAPPFPLRLRIRDLEGHPLADVPVAIRVDGIELGPNHMVAAMSRTGRTFPLASDTNGLYTFPFVSPQDHHVEVRTTATEESEWTTVPPLRPEKAFLLLLE